MFATKKEVKIIILFIIISLNINSVEGTANKLSFINMIPYTTSHYRVVYGIILLEVKILGNK